MFNLKAVPFIKWSYHLWVRRQTSPYLSKKFYHINSWIHLENDFILSPFLIFSGSIVIMLVDPCSVMCTSNFLLYNVTYASLLGRLDDQAFWLILEESFISFWLAKFLLYLHLQYGKHALLDLCLAQIQKERLWIPLLVFQGGSRVSFFAWEVLCGRFL